MQIQTLQTERVLPEKQSLIAFLDRSITSLEEYSVLVITSKVVALCEGRFIAKENKIDETLLQSEADYFLPAKESPYGVPITIRDNAFIARAGIDASNTGGVYSLLPQDSYQTAREVRDHLIQRFKLENIGVIISDSHSTPLRRGVTGVAIGWNGIIAMKEYKDTPDLFGGLFTTHTNIIDALAGAAVLTMGEGAEGTPLAIITDIPFVTFHPDSPTPEELAFFKPGLKDDLFAPLMNYPKLQKGRKEKDQ